MAIFNSYVSLPNGIFHSIPMISQHFSARRCVPASFQEALRPRQGPRGGATRRAGGQAVLGGRFGAWHNGDAPWFKESLAIHK